MVRVVPVLTLLLLAGASGRAQSITLNPGSVLRYTFSVVPSAWGSNPPDVVQLDVQGATALSSTPVNLIAAIYNGSTLLGTVTAPPMTSADTPGLLSLFWKSATSLWSEAPASVIDFTSILNGSIQPRIDLTVTGGSVVIPPPIFDPPEPGGGFNCCISMMYRNTSGAWDSIRGAVSNVVQNLVNSTLPAISLSRSSTSAGSPPFMLTVNGAGFVAGSIVEWNSSPLSTNYLSGSQLSAAIPADLVATTGSASLTVVNPGGAFSTSAPFTISPQGTLSIIMGSPLPPGAVGNAYSQSLAATGGVTPYKSWEVTAGSAPPGLTLATGTGMLTGTPTIPGTYLFTVQVIDAANSVSAAQFSLTIGQGGITLPQNGIVNAASYAGGSVAPGEMLTIFGSGFDATPTGSQLDSRGYISTNLEGLQVLFDGFPAPLIYVATGQISAMVPYLIAGKSSTQIQISYQGRNSHSVTLPVAAALPGIFTIDGSGRGQGAIINQDGTVNSPSSPAPAGSYVSVYGTGEGQTDPGGVDGMLGVAPDPRPLQAVTASIGGIFAPVQYAGGAPGLVAGVIQVNVQIPAGVAPGSSVPIVLNIGGQATQSNVTLAVK